MRSAVKTLHNSPLLYHTILYTLPLYLLYTGRDNVQDLILFNTKIFQCLKYIAFAPARSTRQLLPIRLCILGPPAVGKSAVAKRLCEHYKLHHVHLKDVIDSAIQRVEQSANPPIEGLLLLNA